MQEIQVQKNMPDCPRCNRSDRVCVLRPPRAKRENPQYMCGRCFEYWFKNDSWLKRR